MTFEDFSMELNLDLSYLSDNVADHDYNGLRNAFLADFEAHAKQGFLKYQDYVKSGIDHDFAKIFLYNQPD